MSQRGINWEVNFVLKKRLYLNIQEDSKDPSEYDLLFHQVTTQFHIFPSFEMFFFVRI